MKPLLVMTAIPKRVLFCFLPSSVLISLAFFLMTFTNFVLIGNKYSSQISLSSETCSGHCIEKA